MLTFGCDHELEIFLIMDFVPININSVLSTLRVSLLGINHFLRSSKSEFNDLAHVVISGHARALSNLACWDKQTDLVTLKGKI